LLAPLHGSDRALPSQRELLLPGFQRDKSPAAGSLRHIGLHDTDFATATCGTIRLKLLKIGAIVRSSVRRIKIAMASACLAARDWARAAIRLAIAALARASPA
jgi:Transposase DDE domain group 1